MDSKLDAFSYYKSRACTPAGPPEEEERPINWALNHLPFQVSLTEKATLSYQLKQRKEMAKKVSLMAVLLLFSLFVAIMQAQAYRSGGTECSECISERMKYGCPSCTPVLKCMARCLWGGRSRALCMKMCDCSSNGGKVRLNNCKKCMSKCRCSCLPQMSTNCPVL